MQSRQELLSEISAELDRARTLYHNYHSGHEGWAVIKEELEELWDEIKLSKGTKCNNAMRWEAIQVAATATRFIEDLYK